MNSIKLHIKDFFKSIKSEFNLFSDLVRKRDDLKIKYNNDLLKINLKKEKLWTQMDFSKWELNESEKIAGAQDAYVFLDFCVSFGDIIKYWDAG